MSYQLHPEAPIWFDRVLHKAPIKTLYDVYHVCFSIGIAHSKFTPLEASGHVLTEVIKNYESTQILLLGVMVTASLKRSGVNFNERHTVMNEIERLVKTSSGAPSKEGYRNMNAYALGGFNILREEFGGDKPLEITYLLDKVSNLLKTVS